MTGQSFAQVRATFIDNNDNVRAFRCIATPYHRPCRNNLMVDRIAPTRHLLGKPQESLTLRDVRDIINLVLCGDDQRTLTHKKKVEALWQAEFPTLDFQTRRTFSPYNLHGNNSQPNGRPSSAPTSANGQAARNESLNAGPPQRQPNFDLSSLPQAPSTPSTEAVDSVMNTPNGSSIAEEDESDYLLRSPTLAINNRRALRSEVRRSIFSNTPAAPQADLPGTVVDGAIGMINALVEEGNNAARDSDFAIEVIEEMQMVEPANPPAVENNALDTPFHPGDGSTWAPWTLRSDVLTTLLEPLPKPHAKGSLYAVKVRDQPYVKIGYTTQDVRTRLRQIAREHDQELEIGGAYWRDGIPLIKLIRLEALVHADLAFFQRNLEVQGESARRTHREYFEVDLPTAQRTIGMWLAIMKDIGLEPGQEVDSEVCHKIRQCSRLDVEMLEVREWKIANANHVAREDIWKEVFRLSSGGFGKGRHANFLVWIGGLALVTLILGNIHGPLKYFLIWVMIGVFGKFVN